MNTLSRSLLPLGITALFMGAACPARADEATASASATPAAGSIAKVVGHSHPTHRHLRAAHLNNEGAWLLKEGKCQEAIERLEEALIMEPGYEHAIENLAIAYNNLGLQSPPERALTYFHRALFIEPGNQAVLHNLDCAIAGRGLHSDAPADLIKLAQECASNNDPEGAVIEYQRALNLQKDEDLKHQLDAELARVNFDNGLGAWFATHKWSAHPSLVVALPDERVDYMHGLTQQIERHWQPPSGTENKSAVVHFTINKDGTVADAAIAQPSGVAAFDAKALQSCRDAAPYAPPPADGPLPLAIDFSFACRVVKPRHHNGVTAQLARERLKQAKADTKSGDYISALQRVHHAFDVDRNSAHEQLVTTAEAICANTPPDSAVELLHAAMTIDPCDEVRSLLNKELAKLGVDPRSASARRELADKARNAGNIDTAIVEYQEALRLQPDAQTEAACKQLVDMRRGAALLERWQQALDQENSAENHTGLGYAYELCGDYKRAAAQYNEALSLNPHYDEARDRLKSLPFN